MNGIKCASYICIPDIHVLILVLVLSSVNSCINIILSLDNFSSFDWIIIIGVIQQNLYLMIFLAVMSPQNL